MPAAAPIPESRKKELEGFQRRKCSGHCLKQFLCVWLRHGQGMPAVETASSLGMKANTVRVAQRRFVAEGGGVFASYKRGPKNPNLTAFEEGSGFLGPFREAAENGSALVAAVIKAAWAGQPAPPPCTAC